MGQKQKTEREKKKNILQGLGFGPGSATERWPYRKNAQKSAFFRKKIKITLFFVYIFLLVMPKYWGKQIFRHRIFHEVGEKQKA